MITHTDYINRLNELYKKQTEALYNEIDLIDSKAPEAEIKAAKDLIHNTWLELQALFQDEIDPATKRKVGKGEDNTFVFLD